jgi:hypothetical protein
LRGIRDVGAGVLADQLAAAVEDLEGYRAGDCRRQVIVDRCAIRGIFSGGFVDGQGSIAIGASANAPGVARLEKVGRFGAGVELGELAAKE